MRSIRHVLCVVLSVLLVGSGALTWAQPYEVPYVPGAAPAMNGVIRGDPAWARAAVYELSFTDSTDGSQHVETVYAEHDGTWLYLGVQTHYSDTGWDMWLGCYIDGNGDGQSTGNPTGYPTEDLQIQHAGPSAWGGYTGYGWDAWPNWGWKNAYSGEASAVGGSSDVSFEFKVSIWDMANAPGGTFGMYINNGLYGVQHNQGFPGGVQLFDTGGWSRWQLAPTLATISGATITDIQGQNLRSSYGSLPWTILATLNASSGGSCAAQVYVDGTATGPSQTINLQSGINTNVGIVMDEPPSGQHQIVVKFIGANTVPSETVSTSFTDYRPSADGLPFDNFPVDILGFQVADGVCLGMSSASRSYYEGNLLFRLIWTDLDVLKTEVTILNASLNAQDGAGVLRDSWSADGDPYDWNGNVLQRIASNMSSNRPCIVDILDVLPFPSRPINGHAVVGFGLYAWTPSGSEGQECVVAMYDPDFGTGNLQNFGEPVDRSMHFDPVVSGKSYYLNCNLFPSSYVYNGIPYSQSGWDVIDLVGQ